MPSDADVEEMIDGMKAELGVTLDRELAAELGLKPNAVAAWRARSTIPSKYKLRFRRRVDETIDQGRADVGYHRLRDAYLFALIEKFGSIIDDKYLDLASAEWPEIWRGYCLADAFGYFDGMLPTDGERDDLRRRYQTLRAEIAEGSEMIRLLARRTG